MLRLLALVLLLANGVYFAWGNGLLLPYGLGPAPQREPQRMAQQIEPEAIRLLSAKEFKRIEDQIRADQAPKECLQASALEESQMGALRQALGDNLPSEAWQINETPVAARWIIYMGKYASAEALAKKRAEVVAMNIKTEGLDNATLEPGFSLGSFATKPEADAALARLGSKGLHTARVVQERAATTLYQLRLPAVSAALKPKLEALQGPLDGKPLGPCH